MEDDHARVPGIAGIGDNIPVPLEAEEVETNPVLVKEIHHRIKNHFQVISSLLYLQSRRVQDPAARQMFQDSQLRVRSMALIHEMLHRSEKLGGINFPEYVSDLARLLLCSFGERAANVTISTPAEEIVLGMDTALLCGLIVNELVTNSLKHAFADPPIPGQVRVELRRATSAPPADPALHDGIEREERRFCLIVEDNGRGFPENADLDHHGTLGLTLVNTLTRQLGGRIHLERTGGTRFRIYFDEIEQATSSCQIPGTM